MNSIIEFGQIIYRTHKDDESLTRRVRCIGCGKFVPRSRRWNQCSNCDTREYEEIR